MVIDKQSIVIDKQSILMLLNHLSIAF